MSKFSKLSKNFKISKISKIYKISKIFISNFSKFFLYIGTKIEICFFINIISLNLAIIIFLNNQCNNFYYRFLKVFLNYFSLPNSAILFSEALALN